MHSPLQLEPMRLTPCCMPDKITVYACVSRRKDRRREKILHHADLFCEFYLKPALPDMLTKSRKSRASRPTFSALFT